MALWSETTTILEGTNKIGDWVKRVNRLTRSTEFKRVRRSGSSYAHPFIVLVTAPNSENTARFGIITSKALGTAVVRNRIKRRIRACIHESFPFIKEGWDIIIIARKPAINAKYAEIKDALIELLQRASLINL